MPIALDAIDAAIREATAARNRVQRIKQKQLRGIDTLAMLKSTAHAWFNTHRQVASSNAPTTDLGAIDICYLNILTATGKHSARSTYLNELQNARDCLLEAREDLLIRAPSKAEVATGDVPPDFSPLVGNQEMRAILSRRWHECSSCVKVGAHLAAIVMMGGLLEALFVARANKLPDKSSLTNAKGAPKDAGTGKTLNYQEWMLDSYIKVAHELKWITASAKDVADKLKEYRNFIHPAKELRYGVQLGLNDSSIFWDVTKALAHQLLLSA